MVEALPKTVAGKVVAQQIIRAATSVGANYRAACRARSKADFISKLGIVVEEADECCYWLQLITDSGMLTDKQINELSIEAKELTAIFIASTKTASTNNQHSKIKNQKSA